MENDDGCWNPFFFFWNHRYVWQGVRTQQTAIYALGIGPILYLIFSHVPLAGWRSKITIDQLILSIGHLTLSGSLRTVRTVQATHGASALWAQGAPFRAWHLMWLEKRHDGFDWKSHRTSVIIKMNLPSGDIPDSFASSQGTSICHLSVDTGR
jgi:hypothetical protein